MKLIATGGASYLWSNGATTSSVTATSGGNYTVTVTGSNGCTATSAPATVAITPLPGAPVITGSSSVLRGGTYTYSVVVPNATSYNWTYTSNGVGTCFLNHTHCTCTMSHTHCNPGTCTLNHTHCKCTQSHQHCNYIVASCLLSHTHCSCTMSHTHCTPGICTLNHTHCQCSQNHQHCNSNMNFATCAISHTHCTCSLNHTHCNSGNCTLNHTHCQCLQIHTHCNDKCAQSHVHSGATCLINHTHCTNLSTCALNHTHCNFGTNSTILGNGNDTIKIYFTNCTAPRGVLTVYGSNACGNGPAAVLTINTNAGATINCFTAKLTTG